MLSIRRYAGTDPLLNFIRQNFGQTIYYSKVKLPNVNLIVLVSETKNILNFEGSIADTIDPYYPNYKIESDRLIYKPTPLYEIPAVPDLTALYNFHIQNPSGLVGKITSMNHDKNISEFICENLGTEYFYNGRLATDKPMVLVNLYRIAGADIKKKILNILVGTQYIDMVAEDDLSRMF
jgi:hypothetical protein